MAGEIQLNSTSFASESSGTITVNNGTLSSSVVFPTMHVIQNITNIYGFTADVEISDGTVNSTANLVGPEVSLTLKNQNAKVLFTCHLSETRLNNNVTAYLYLMGGTVSKGSTDLTTISSHSSSIIPPVTMTGQDSGSRKFFMSIRTSDANNMNKQVSFGGLGQCTNSAGATFYFKIGVGATGSGFLPNMDGNNGTCSIILQEIQL